MAVIRIIAGPHISDIRASPDGYVVSPSRSPPPSPQTGHPDLVIAVSFNRHT
ncbi:uncharacterized protein FFC1_13816 [Fusarium fujikuroi]|nr:uncharacterized protein FFC1_13816 [Fusarium fujikuroi]